MLKLKSLNLTESSDNIRWIPEIYTKILRKGGIE